MHRYSGRRGREEGNESRPVEEVLGPQRRLVAGRRGGVCCGNGRGNKRGGGFELGR